MLYEDYLKSSQNVYHDASGAGKTPRTAENGAAICLGSLRFREDCQDWRALVVDYS